MVQIDPDDTGTFAKDVARRLLQYREILDLPQNAFAAAAQLSPQRYYQYESGVRLLTLNAAIKLCGQYNLTLDYLYLGDPSGLPNRICEQLKKIKINKA